MYPVNCKKQNANRNFILLPARKLAGTPSNPCAENVRVFLIIKQLRWQLLLIFLQETVDDPILLIGRQHVNVHIRDTVEQITLHKRIGLFHLLDDLLRLHAFGCR